jgi:polyisoprenoid-binding protein YceI
VHRLRRTLTAAVLLALALAGAARAQQGPAQPPLPSNGWRVDPNHSGVRFRVRHLGMTWVNGEFRTWTADLVYDPANPMGARVAAQIQVASISTDNDMRDSDLRSARFFAADSFPQMTFVSTRVEAVDSAHLRITGDLTIRGVTRQVVLDTEIGGTTTGQRSRRIAFSATTTIDRKDWGMTFSPVQEGIRSAGDEVRITIDIEAVRPNS